MININRSISIVRYVFILVILIAFVAELFTHQMSGVDTILGAMLGYLVINEITISTRLSILEQRVVNLMDNRSKK